MSSCRRVESSGVVRAARLLFALVLAFSAPHQNARAEQRWLMTSDLHVDPFDTSAAPSSYGSDSNWSLFNAALAAMRRVDPHPSVVVIAGDFLAHRFQSKAAAADQQPAAAAAATMQRIARSFAQAFPHARFLIAFGNNDDPCGDYEITPNGAFLATAARIWAPLVMRDGASPAFPVTFARGAYYTATLPNDARAVVVNSVYWSSRYRNACGKGSDPGLQEFSWLERALAAHARTVMLAHIPPGIDAYSTAFARRFLVISFLNASANARFVHDVASPGSGVVTLIGGHLHSNTFGVLGAVPMLILPSISPVFGNNPSFIDALVYQNGTLHDYATYEYLPDRRRWNAALDFDRAYGAGQLDGRALLAVHTRLAHNARLRAVWASAYVAGSPRADITAQNWRVFWCAQTLFDLQYTACAGAQTSVIPLAGGVLLAAAGVLAAIGALRRWCHGDA